MNWRIDVKIVLVLMSVILLMGCTTTGFVLEQVSDKGILKACEEVAPDVREVLRVELAESCKAAEPAGVECGIVMQCKGQSWGEVLRPLGYQATPLP